MAQNHQYIVSVDEQKGPDGALIFTFVPKSSQEGTAPNGQHRAPQYVVAGRQAGNQPVVEWVASSDDPGTAKDEIETEVRARLNELAIWIDRVTALVGQIEQWAKEMNWTTRRVDKRLDDVRVGVHRVPGLLMQVDTCKILLEPIGRSAPGAEGVVDLYLMPGYDDIANLYYYDGRWNVHYTFPSSKAVATVSEGTAVPLSKEILEKIVAEMKEHAA